MATRYIDIPIFSGGLVTNADLEDIPKDAASATSNMDLDVYGKLKKRKPRSLSYTVTGSHFKQLLHWVTPSGSDHWIGYETQNNNIEFWTTNFQREHGLIDDLTDANVTDVKIINFGDEVRIANGIHEKASFINQTKRQYFFGTWKPCDANSTDTGMDTDATVASSTSTVTVSYSGTASVSVGDYIRIDSECMLVTAVGDDLTVTRAQLGTSVASHSSGVSIYYANVFITGNAELAYPTTWDYQAIENTTYTLGTVAAGHYYYKFVPIFDGTQEAPFGDSFSYFEQTSGNANKPIKVGLKVDTDDYNRRITGVNLYRSFLASDHTPSYELVKTISLNTQSTSKDRVATTAGHVGSVIYDTSAPFVSGDIGKWIMLHKTSNQTHLYRIAALVSSSAVRIDNRWSISGGALDPGTFAGITTAAWGATTGWAKFNNTGSGTPSPPSISDTSNAVASATATSGDTSKLYYGLDTVWDASYDFDNDEKLNWVAVEGSDVRLVTNSHGNMVKVGTAFSAYGTSETVTLTNGYYYDVDSTEITLYAYDTGLNDTGGHPLANLSKTTVNYKYGQYINGRFFVGNVRLDPDSEAEDHKNWIIYSQLNQPDVLPITNYIQIKDDQGGAITGLQKLFDDLAVFMERGVYRLHIPSSEPTNWSLLESNENVGCIAPNSIVKVGSNIFFAGSDHIYSLDTSFNVVPLTDPIKDVYQGSTALESTRGIYDPKKQRILFSFGTDTRYVYTLDLLRFQGGEIVWNKHDMGTTAPVDMISIDKDLTLYTVNNLSS